MAPQKKPAAQKKETEKKEEKKRLRKEEKKGMEEEPEEEEAEDDQAADPSVQLPCKDSKALVLSGKLTESNLANHEALIQKAKTMSAEDFEEQFKKLSHTEQQQLWKKFEYCRKQDGQEETYKKTTEGTGGNKKKKRLLLGWCQDSGSCGEMYKEYMHNISVTKSNLMDREWVSSKKMIDELGEREFKMRVEAGTIKFHKNPEDPRFFQFRKVTERESVGLHEQKVGARKVSAKTGQEDLVAFHGMDFGDVTEGNFTFDGEQASASQDAGPETELYASMGWKAPKDPSQGNPKPGKKDKWEELSGITDENSGQIKDKILNFKSELGKDLVVLEDLAERVQDKGIKKDVNKQVLKAKESLKHLENLLKNKKFEKTKTASALVDALQVLKETKSRKAAVTKHLKS